MPRHRPHPTWTCHGGSARGQGRGGRSGAPRSTHRGQGQAGLHAARGSGVPRRAVARPATSGRRRRAEAAERRWRACEWKVEKEQGRLRASRARRRAAEFKLVRSQAQRSRGLAAEQSSWKTARRPLPPPSQRPRLGSGRGGGAPARAPASRGGMRRGGGRSAPSTSPAPSPYSAKDPPASN